LNANPNGGTTPYQPLINGVAAPGAFSSLAPTNKFIFEAGELTAALNFIESSVKGKLVQSPNVIAQHGTTTFMRSVTNVPFASGGSTNGASGTTESSVQYLQIGTTLNVTAFIENDEGDDTSKWSLYLDLKPEISATDGSVLINGNATPQFIARAPTTQVRIRNGDTVLIGGLTSSSFSETREGIPYLKDIPVLGFLFGTRGKERQERELAMLVTAEIVDIDHKAVPNFSKENAKQFRDQESKGADFSIVKEGTDIVPVRVKQVNPRTWTSDDERRARLLEISN
jgi:general secretion pathway protein D